MKKFSMTIYFVDGKTARFDHTANSEESVRYDFYEAMSVRSLTQFRTYNGVIMNPNNICSVVIEEIIE